jgi:hypothetical protein
MTAASGPADSGEDRRDSWARPGVQLSVRASRMVVHFLGELAEITRQRNGCAPIGLVELQHSIAEAAAAIGDSRRRDSEALPAPEVLALAQEPTISVKEAARMLKLQPDSVRLMCRRRTLDAEHVEGRWFPRLAAVQEMLRRRAERSA